MIEKVRVHEIAKELGIASKDVIKKASEIGLDTKSAQSTVSMEEAEQLSNYIMSGESPLVASKQPDATADKAITETQKQPDVTTPKENSPTDTKEEKKTEAPKTKTVASKEVSKAPTSTEVEPAQKEQSAPVVAKVEVVAEDTSVIGQVKRSGLKIVKKKVVKEDPIVMQRESSKKQASLSTYGKMSAEALAELTSKKKVRQSASPTQRKEHGVKLDIFGDSLNEVSMDMDNQVTLIDLNDTQMTPVIEEVQKPRPPKPIGRNANKKPGSRPRNVSRERRKTYVKPKLEDEVITHVEIPEDIRVYEFAEKTNKSLGEVIKVLFSFGLMMTKNDFLGSDEIEILSDEFGIEVTVVDPKEAFNYEEDLAEEIDADATERPPVITIMGHVDHGKTSLLDAIRHSKVGRGEAGGITQHIGAYTITQDGKAITFLDTPGHAAFGAMRQRGTDITDIIVIVVAADDGVKPQTEEVIKLAKESGAPIIVAVNKMDKETANPDMVKAQMAERGLNPVEWGGDIEFIHISAKTGLGIDTLLENILITADVLELRANENAMAKATVVESSLEKGRGPVATVIVQNGTL
ncbi:MAG: translation initiation factor IF-2 N-terminal domain-containing protein, partial [Sulfurimonadaceae bacterium]|nr:translation initiation factor IF-2 N-terminal domain-containing protein [Sulfurimonadaceae bacterium]